MNVAPPSADLHSHDDPAGHVSHLVHHSVRSPAQLLNLLQVICQHHKVLDGAGDRRPLLHVFIIIIVAVVIIVDQHTQHTEGLDAAALPGLQF